MAYVVAWGIPVWIALLTIASIDRYGKVELTRTPLRIGRAGLPTRADRPGGPAAAGP